MKTSSEVLGLGRRHFRVASADAGMVAAVESLFAKSSGALDQSPHEIDLDAFLESYAGDDSGEGLTPLDMCVNHVIGQVLSLHDNCLWLDASCVVSPNGRTALFAGDSGAGKTTLCLSLCLAGPWRAVSEDITVIDLAGPTLIPIVRPSSVRPEGVKVIESVSGKLELRFGRWLRTDIFAGRELAAKFDLAVVLASPFESGQTLSVKLVEADAFLRRLLPLGNALRKAGAVDVLRAALPARGCYALAGGTIGQRVAAIGDLV